jgi:hypothetical protein
LDDVEEFGWAAQALRKHGVHAFASAIGQIHISSEHYHRKVRLQYAHIPRNVFSCLAVGKVVVDQHQIDLLFRHNPNRGGGIVGGKRLAAELLQQEDTDSEILFHVIDAQDRRLRGHFTRCLSCLDAAL